MIKSDLQKRADLLRQIRDFFHQKVVLEVETPCLVSYPTIDRNLDSFEVHQTGVTKFLITSPEYHMKRLLAAGSGSIYQICKCFRAGETGRYHNPEFTMIEWYRTEWDHQQLMKEVDELLQITLKTNPAYYTTYEDVFKEKLGINPFEFCSDEFIELCRQKDIIPPEDLLRKEGNFRDQLDFLMAMLVEPQLGLDAPVIVEGFPSFQSSLAQTDWKDRKKSCRFEVYYKGLELGNGYSELRDGNEQKCRMEKENRYRAREGKPMLALDPGLQAAMDSGLPKCAGIAMGFDRLLLLSQKRSSIDEVQSFSWSYL
ncbi:MAG: EF-P lysine aminoacylase GenX [Proteobacteria bacterium]|nr:EF-P lysine aminoacylase GenX [Pseudomonadota bacterium]